ncbi:unnamed protein product [Caenorhabditis auriculariae]|uniref:Cell division control protein 73 C-terminal domain-containing protein n=1 Tax=Caenorhabditis auriculariae TaxID=2777116 RepID=A0A8S1GY31_9PELO|nr:unnamed protein product [Caenorhabditis auriculariae]
MKLLQRIRDSTITGCSNIEERAYDGEYWYKIDETWYAGTNVISLSVRGDPEQMYTLGALIILWFEKDKSHKEYVKVASTRGFQPINRGDRNSILDYLDGMTARNQFPDSYTKRDEVFEVNLKTRRTIPSIKSEIVDSEEEPETKANVYRATVAEKIKIEDLPEFAQMRQKRLRQLHARKSTIAAVERARSPTDINANTVVRNVERPRLAERTWRNRTTIMGSNKSFLSILDTLQAIKDREEGTKKVPAEKEKPLKVRSEDQPYSRYAQEQFNRTFPFEEKHHSFANLPFATAISEVLSQPSDGASSMKEEKPFGNASKLIKFEVFSPPKNVPKSVPRAKHRTPIIVVPPATSATILSLKNVASLLEDMNYTDMHDLVPGSLVGRAQRIIQRKRSGNENVSGSVPYLVIDDPTKLRKEDWDRIVAVFVMGPAWQFKNWRWQSPVEIFTKVPAFHLYFDDMKVHDNVTTWNVTRIPINRHKRHLDASQMLKFWEIVDRHIMKSASNLRF